MKFSQFVEIQMNEPKLELYHGSRRWDGLPEIRPAKKGRYECGCGIYLTNKFQTAVKYAKGGGSLMVFDLEPNLQLAHQVQIPLEEMLEFLNSNSIRRKFDIAQDLRSYAERTGRSVISADILNNLVVNYESGSGKRGLDVANWLKNKGVDAYYERQSGGEFWLVLIDTSVILSYRKVSQSDVPVDRYLLPDPLQNI